MRALVTLCLFAAIAVGAFGQDELRSGRFGGQPSPILPSPSLILPSPSPPPDYSALQRELDANRAKFFSQGFQRYEMTIAVNCFCIEDARGPFTLVVVNGVVTSVMPDNDFSRNAPTIGRLFTIIQEAINNGAANIVVEFNPQFGYPQSVFIDRDLRIADEEIGYEVQSFNPGPSPSLPPASPSPSPSPSPSLPPASPSPSPRPPFPGKRNGFNPNLHRIQQRRWNFRGPKSYKYRLARWCFCPRETVGPFIITVENGRVVKAELESGNDISDDVVNGLPTISELFDVIAERARTADRVEISYDRRFGYPRRAFIDQIKNAIDDEITYEASILP